MPETPQLLAFIAAGLLLNLTPGPDVFFIVTQALRGGLRAGLAAALGVAAGCGVHIVAATVGVGALVAASATAFAVLKWAGAAYLVYVGVSMLGSRGPRSAPDSIAAGAGGSGAQGTSGPRNSSGSGGVPPEPSAAPDRLGSVFRRGFWTNALNPKVALFFLAFVPQFIAPHTAHPSLAFLALGLLFDFNGLWVNAGWACAAAWTGRRVGRGVLGPRGLLRWLERAAGLVFIGFGLRLALAAAPAR